MTDFLGELSKKLAERWLALLVLPGLLFVATATLAMVLGQNHALDQRRLRLWIDGVAAHPSSHSISVELLAVGATLAASAGAGLIAAVLGWLAQRAWIAEGRWPPLRWLAAARRKRWETAYEKMCALLTVTARPVGTSEKGISLGADLAQAIERCARIGLIRAERPTWIGDRLRAAGERVYRTNRIDLTAAWPRLWLIISDATRSELAAAYGAFAAAGRLIGWACLYLVLSVRWWPALIIAVVALSIGWIRARSATAVLADLVEAISDLHAGGLARQLGIDCNSTVTPDIGHAVTQTLRKDDTIHSGRVPGSLIDDPL